MKLAMPLRSRRLVAGVMALLSTAATSLHAVPAAAQAFPTRPVHFIVGFPPGGGSDVSARVVAAAMEKPLGVSVVVENKPGAGALVGAQYVAKAEADGYTLFFGSVASFHPLFLKSGLDAASVFSPVSNLQVGGMIFADLLNLPAGATLQDMVAWSKAHPGKLNFASVGVQADLYMQMLKARTGLDFVAIPYKGEAPIVTALLGGEVDVALSNILAVMPQVQAGKMNAMWISRSHRSSIAPGVPTLPELGVNGVLWEFNLGLWAPKGTPPAAIQKLNAAAVAAAKQPEVIEQFRKFGADATGTSAEQELQTYVDEMKFWTEAARLANFQPQ